MTSQLCKEYEKTISKSCIKNPKAFWNYLRVSDLKDSYGALNSKSKDKANSISNEFSHNVFTSKNILNVLVRM